MILRLTLALVFTSLQCGLLASPINPGLDWTGSRNSLQLMSRAVANPPLTEPVDICPPYLKNNIVGKYKTKTFMEDVKSIKKNLEKGKGLESKDESLWSFIAPELKRSKMSAFCHIFPNKLGREAECCKLRVNGFMYAICLPTYILTEVSAASSVRVSSHWQHFAAVKKVFPATLSRIVSEGDEVFVDLVNVPCDPPSPSLCSEYVRWACILLLSA